MKKGIKRSMGMAITFLLCFLFVFGMGGCTIIPDWKEEGDFIYRLVRTKEGKIVAKLKGLSEAGKQKEILVIPEEIEGGQVTSLLYGYNVNVIKSDVVKKIFMPKLPLGEGSLIYCSSLEKVILYSYDFMAHKVNLGRLTYSKCYVSSYSYSLNDYESNIYDKGDVDICFANVSYMYNYDTTKNNGYYWIDDYDYGSKIEFVPQDPIREGYAFNGWYKEPECVNKWDFETDTLPEEIIEEDLVKYQETKLYAKWETA